MTTANKSLTELLCLLVNIIHSFLLTFRFLCRYIPNNLMAIIKLLHRVQELSTVKALICLHQEVSNDNWFYGSQVAWDVMMFKAKQVSIRLLHDFPLQILQLWKSSTSLLPPASKRFFNNNLINIYRNKQHEPLFVKIFLFDKYICKASCKKNLLRFFFNFRASEFF